MRIGVCTFGLGCPAEAKVSPEKGLCWPKSVSSPIYYSFVALGGWPRHFRSTDCTQAGIAALQFELQRSRRSDNGRSKGFAEIPRQLSGFPFSWKAQFGIFRNGEVSASKAANCVFQKLRWSGAGPFWIGNYEWSGAVPNSPAVIFRYGELPEHRLLSLLIET